MIDNFQLYVNSIGYNKFIELIASDPLFLNEAMLLEDRKLYKIVILPGKFQPFHRGDYEIYRNLAETYGEGKVYLAMETTQDLESAQLTIDEQKYLISQLYGIPEDKMIPVKNVRMPIEILNNFDSEKTVFIEAISRHEKDVYESDDYYQEYYATKQHRPYRVEGYYILYDDSETLDLTGHKLSGKRIQKILQNPNLDEKTKRKYMKQAMGKIEDELFGLMMTKFNASKLDPDAEVEPLKLKEPKKIEKPKLKTKLSDPNVKASLRDLMHDRIFNPATGREIFVISALQYDKNHPARKAAKMYIKQKLQGSM